MTDHNQTAAFYTVVYDVRGDRQKHDEWWCMIHCLPDGISIKASSSFDALAKLDELEGEAALVSNEQQNQAAAAKGMTDQNPTAEAPATMPEAWPFLPRSTHVNLIEGCPHERQRHQNPTAAIWLLMARLSRSDGLGSASSAVMGWRLAHSEEGARGSFQMAVAKVKPGFSIDEITCTRLPEAAMRSALELGDVTDD